MAGLSKATALLSKEGDCDRKEWPCAKCTRHIWSTECLQVCRGHCPEMDISTLLGFGRACGSEYEDHTQQQLVGLNGSRMGTGLRRTIRRMSRAPSSTRRSNTNKGPPQKSAPPISQP